MMADCETGVTNFERFQAILKGETYNLFNKKKRKKRKHKLAVAESTQDSLTTESNKALNKIVQLENVETKELICNEKESPVKKKETNCIIIQSDNAEKPNVNSKKLHIKKKHKVNNDENVSDCGISKLNRQDLENCARVEIPNEHRKKQKHVSVGEMENEPSFKIKESDKEENNRILDELNKRKRHHKQRKRDNMSDCLSNSEVELSQNNLNDATSSGVYKKKRKKRHKLLKTDNIELNHLSNVSICNEGGEEGMKEKSDSESISKLNRKNRNFESKAKNQPKKKRRSTNDSCKFVEQSVSEKSDGEIKPNIFCEKKGKHKTNNDEFAPGSKIEEVLMQELENDTYSKFFKGLGKQKKKKDKHNLLDKMEIVLNQEPGDKKIQDVLVSPKKEGKHKQTEGDNVYHRKTVESDHNVLNKENSSKFHGKKKKHKLFCEMKNTSDCEVAGLTSIRINKNDLNSENVSIFHEKKKCESKSLDEMKNTTDFEAEDSNLVEINQDDLNSENGDRLCEKKRKKHKNELLDEIPNASHSKSVKSDPIDISKSDFNKLHKKKKKKYKLFNLEDNICKDYIQESTINETDKNSSLDALHVHNIIDSGAIEKNPSEFSNETINQHCRENEKRHRLNFAKVESMAKTVTESDNNSNDVHHEHTKEFLQENNLENSVVDISSRTNEKSKKHEKNRIEVLSDNLQEKGKNVISEGYAESYREDTFMSFNPFIHDMTYEPVSFPVPVLHNDETVCSITPEKRAYLEKNGVEIQTGKWTKSEDDTLIRNFKEFGLEFGVNNPFQLLGINQHKKDNEVEKFKKAKHFLLRLGRDLNNRSLRSIYMRARKLLTPLKNGEKLSTKETNDLKQAYQQIGKKWTIISDMLSISDSTCQTALRWHKDDINKGKWTLEEERSLIKAIKTVSGEEDISANNLKNISWKAVAKYVPNRNEFQCHKHWAEHLAWDTSVSKKERWEKHHYAKLIYLLKETYCFNSELEINWRELHKHFKDVAPSYIFLRKKWLYLKGRLPKEFNFNFSKCLDVFKNKYESEYKKFANTVQP